MIWQPPKKQLTSVMKIDVKGLRGRQLSADAADEQKSVWEAYGCAKQGRDYRWMGWGVPVIIGCLLAKVSWTALLIFLGFCGGAVALAMAAIAWIDTKTHPFI